MRVVCESAEKRVQDAYERGYHDGVKKVSGSSVLTVPLFQFPLLRCGIKMIVNGRGKLESITVRCILHPGI